MTCSRSMAFVVRADFHCSTGSRVKVKRSSPASSSDAATASHFTNHLLRNALRFFATVAASLA